jgi:protein TonB
VGSVEELKENSRAGGSAGESLGNLGSTRANPMAVEIPVNATGTRPGSGPDKRELFSEETATVLVFPDGAVIRLSAAVATGQLIFLTNKQNNAEIVSQVIGKRVYRPMSCYVELKFTEAIEGFWGVDLTKHAAEAVRADTETDAAPGETVAEEVASAESIDESGAPMREPPTGQEVEELREEVEALRRQLKEMKDAEASAKAVANMAGPDGNATSSTSQNWIAPVAEKKKEILASVNEQTPVTASASAEILEPPHASVPTNVWNGPPPEPVVTPEPVVARKSHVGMSLPNREPARIDPEQEVMDQLLPQPELDFSKAPIPSKERDPSDPYSIYKPTRAGTGKWTLVLLVAVLVGAVGFGAWQLGFVNRLMALRKKTAPAAGTVKAVAAAKAPEIPKTVTPPSAVGESVAPAGAGSVTATGPAAGLVAANANESAIPAASSTPASPVTAPKSEAGNAVAEKSEVKTIGAAVAVPAAAATVEKTKRERAAAKNTGSAAAKKKAAVVKKEPEAAPAEVAPSVVEEGPLVPAKLLKSVGPVYPPDAMRNFITGDVIMKAEVDENGKILNMEVVSGPKALREAAMEALKQYQYQPATKGGKGVTSWVRVTVKFWFDP